MIDVNKEQALELLNSGRNIFLTGGAGAGKTYLIKEWANKRKNIALTATTGIAALNLGGETIHKFSSIGIATRPEYADVIIKRIMKFKGSSKPWERVKWNLLQSVKTIIIDETSMLRRDQFELLEVVFSAIRDDTRPFGGIQMVLVGDFLQLPPVVPDQDLRKYPDLDEPYPFQSYAWKHGSFITVNLTTQYRQSDQDFLSVLNKIRLGKVDDQVNKLMATCVRDNVEGDISPIKIFTHKANVHTQNIKELKLLPSKKFRSLAKYTGKNIPVDMLKRDAQAEDELFFCEGAQIMMITNHPEGLYVNGTMGKITGVEPLTIQLSDGLNISPVKFDWEKYEYRFVGGKIAREVVATMKQYPFKLAWSSTIHKTQGLTLDYVDLDISNCFAPGQAYVALSRVKTLDGLKIKEWKPKAIQANKDVLNFYGYK